jgi:hypothetical protein
MQAWQNKIKFRQTFNSLQIRFWLGNGACRLGSGEETKQELAETKSTSFESVGENPK